MVVRSCSLLLAIAFLTYFYVLCLLWVTVTLCLLVKALRRDPCCASVAFKYNKNLQNLVTVMLRTVTVT